MKEFILISIFILSSTPLFSQKIISEQDIKLYNDDIKSYVLVHDNDNTISIIQEDDTNLQIQHLDKEFNVSKYLFFPKEKFGSTHILACETKDDNYILYLENSVRKNIITGKREISFSQKIINSKSGSWENHDLPFTLEGETLLSFFIQNDLTYFLTIKNKESVLKLYLLKGIKMIDSKTFDLSTYKEFGKKNTRNLLEIVQGLGAASEFAPSLNPKIITSNISTIKPNDINLHTKTSKKIKIYYSSDKIYLTEDYNKSETTVITIDLNQLTHTIKEYKHNNISCENKSYSFNSSDSNSFIIDDKLYLVSTCKEEIVFSIMDLVKDEKIQSFSTKKNKITYEDNSSDSRTSFFAFSNKTTIPNPKKVLTKLAQGNIFITAYQKENEIKITIGRFQAEKKGSVSYVGTDAGVIPIVGVDYRSSILDFCFNPVLDNSHFELISNKSKNNKSLDDIRQLFKIHKEEMKANIVAPAILPYENGYLLGYYYLQKQKYYLRKFTD